MNKELVCLKCSAPMEKGFILDVRNYARDASKWIEGIPEFDNWTITKIEGKRMYYIQSFRCTSCGYLENYAIHTHVQQT